VDNLVLVRVAAALAAEIEGSLLVHVGEETETRFRLVFESGGRRIGVTASLHPVLPWIGRPPGPSASRGQPAKTAFAAGLAKAFRGLRVARVEKLGPDRVLVVAFSDGSALVAELLTHGANLVHLDGSRRVVACARHSGRREPAGPRRAYEPPPLPEGRLVRSERRLETSTRSSIARAPKARRRSRR